MDIILGKNAQKDLLGNLLGQIEVGSGNLVLHLFQNDLAISRNTPTSDLVEANFAGYGNVTKPYLPEFLDGNGAWRSQVGEAVFAANGTGNLPQTIYGFWCDGGNESLIGKFDQPITLNDPGDGFALGLGLTTIQLAGQSVAVGFEAEVNR